MLVKLVKRVVMAICNDLLQFTDIMHSLEDFLKWNKTTHTLGRRWLTPMTTYLIFILKTNLIERFILDVSIYSWECLNIFKFSSIVKYLFQTKCQFLDITHVMAFYFLLRFITPLQAIQEQRCVVKIQHPEMFGPFA